MSKRKTVDNLFNDAFDNMNTVREDVDGYDKKIIYVRKKLYPMARQCNQKRQQYKSPPAAKWLWAGFL